MEILRSVVFATLVSLGLNGAASAHFPEEALYRVFQFPDNLLPVMDGDLRDWDIVPESYWTDTYDLMETVRGLGTDFDVEDLSVLTAVGWNDTQNRLYFVVKGHDDILNMEHEGYAGVHGGDIWEIVIDADHSGGIYNGFSKTDQALEDRYMSSHAQNYHILFPPSSEDWTVWLWGKAQWTCSLPYAKVGWTLDGEPEGRGTVYQEISVTPFDDLHWAGIDSSIVHDLKEGEILGISWSFLDYDENDDQYDGFWNLSHMTRMDHTADLLPDFVLAPVEGPASAVEADAPSARPPRFDLKQNHPNPFNSATTITYHLAEAGWVRLEIYDLAGQRLETLVDGHRGIGTDRVAWDGRNMEGATVSTGVYLVRLRASNGTKVKKMLLIR